MRRVIKRLLQLTAAALGLLMAVSGLVLYWNYHRPQPEVAHRELFKGITYDRIVRQRPRPLVIHVAKIDLDAPGIRLKTTPGVVGAARPYRAQTVSHFLQSEHVQLAINGDFFKPWWSNGPWDYYPHVGDPIEVSGPAVHEGVVVQSRPHVRPSIYISKDGKVDFERPRGSVYDVLSGESLFLKDGVYTMANTNGHYRLDCHPRTCIALDKSKRYLFLIVVDGRQPGYSEGATVRELADIVLELGGWSAMDMDGGGSATMVAEGKSGTPEILSCPIDNHIPNRERPVANHLGIFADHL